MIGRLGDAAIYSFPKTLPVSEGGALVVQESNEKIIMTLRYPEWHRVYPIMVSLFKRWLIRTCEKAGDFGMSQKLFGKNFMSYMSHRPSNEETSQKFMREYNYFDKKIIDYSISRITEGILNQQDYTEIVRIRRRNYIQLYKDVCDLPGIQPLYNVLPEGVCPLSLPLLVSDRQRMHSILKKRGIDAIMWWGGYHRSLSWENFPEAVELKDHILSLPIHQDLDEVHIKYIADCVKSLSLT